MRRSSSTRSSLEQLLHELGAAVDDDVPVDLPLRLLDLFGEVAAEHGGVVPLGILQCRRHDVLGHAVELVGELAVT